MSEKFIPISDADQIELQHHGAIEASAGTGKTFTIENLIARMIMQGVSIERILVVTFTEKATSEMKERIRKLLANKADDPDLSEAERLYAERATLCFDQSKISTIHSFCLNLIKEFAYENKSLFDMKVADDGLLYEEAWRNMLRRDFGGKFQPSRDALLALINSKKLSRETCIKIAQDFSEENGDIIYPEDAQEGELDSMITNAEKLICDIHELTINRHQTNLDNYISLLDRLNLKVKPKEKIVEFLKIVLPLYLSHDKNAYLKILQDKRLSLPQIKDSHVLEYFYKNKENPEALDGFESLTRTLLELLKIDERFVLVAKKIVPGILSEEVERIKLKESSIAFSDMIKKVHSYILNNDSFRRKIRSRFSYVIVDEFQDTDVLQWEIFKRICLYDGGPRLFVVGDPKQSIYGFRGADVNTYIKARDEIASPKNRGKLYRLSLNWRSSKQMVDELNHFFLSRGWFENSNAGEGIEYTKVEAPNDQYRRSKVAVDNTETGCLNERFPVGEIMDDIRKDFADSIATTITTNLMAKGDDGVQGSRFCFRMGGEDRRLNYSDICILIRTRTDLPPVIEALNKNMIPYTYSAKNLFSTQEAGELRFVIKALSPASTDSDIKAAMLTSFFGVEPQKLDLELESGAVEGVLMEMRKLATRKNWHAIFRDLLENTAVNSVLREKKNQQKDLNFKKLFRICAEVAIQKRMDADALLSWMKMMKDRPEEEGGALDEIPAQDNQNAVQILTMHSAKGLEFPVVFIAPTGNGKFSDDFFVENNDGKRAFSFCSETGITKKAKEERKKENKRLFYVALTRAVFKLFIPQEKSKLNDCLYPYEPPSDTEAKKEPTPQPSSFGFTELMTDFKLDEQVETHQLETFQAGCSFLHRLNESNSFSSLNRRHHKTEDNFFDDRDDKGDDEAGTRSLDSITTSINDDILPKGKELGSAIHEVFEHLYQRKLAELTSDPDKPLEECLILIRQRLDNYQLLSGETDKDDKMIQALWKIVFNTLNHEYDFGDKKARLKDCEVLPEPDFRFHLENGNGREVYLNGAIDAVLRFDNKYWVVDWKSNYLHDGYGQDSMKDEMVKANYILQAKVYASALRRWLLDCGISDTLFGGVFYLFVRGIGELSNGVYFLPPSELTEEDTSRELRELSEKKSNSSVWMLQRKLEKVNP